jgi:hypothetical protein
MPHLDPDRLAELHEAPPTEAEREHLAACAPCRTEAAAFAALARLAIAEGERGRPDVVRIDGTPVAPLTSWEALRPRLVAEGLLGTSVPPAAAPAGAGRVVGALGAPSPRRVAWWQAAAAAVLLTAGGVLGRVTAPGAAPADRGAMVTATPVADAAGFASEVEAQAALDRAQRLYQSAALWLAANDTTAHSADVYRTRLAALDEMMAASRAALRAAPQDPVLNQYYLNTYSTREATLRQLGSVLPAVQTIESY